MNVNLNIFLSKYYEITYEYNSSICRIVDIIECFLRFYVTWAETTDWPAVVLINVQRNSLYMLTSIL